MSILKSILKAGAAVVGVDLEKRAGLYVSRPIVNGQRWYDWAVKAGIPDPVPADRMHVTIVYSRVDVKCRPQTSTYDVGTDRVVLQRLGADGGVLVAMWDDYFLSDRHWFFRQSGATSDWAGYRVHMTLSYSAGDYEIPDDMLAEMPEMIILGGEVHSALNEDAVADLKKSAPAGDANRPDEADQKAAGAALAYALEKGLGGPVERAALRDLAAGHPISNADLQAIAKAEWAQEVLAPEVGADVATGEGRDEDVIKRAAELLKAAVLDPSVDAATVAALDSLAKGEDVHVMKLAALPSDILEKLAGFISAPRDLLKADGLQVDSEEMRIAWGWASVSHVNGESVTDLHKHEITTKALYKMAHGLIQGQRAGDFEHDQSAANEIVEAMVFCKARQEALGIDLGKEGLLISMHVPDDNNWELVKSGDWMFSIDARGTLTTIED